MELFCCVKFLYLCKAFFLEKEYTVMNVLIRALAYEFAAEGTGVSLRSKCEISCFIGELGVFIFI